jgi:Flp pilus assembly protein TadG
MRHQRSGQALLEFALMISLVMMLVAAAIDLGGAFRSYQTLMNATAEASSYLMLEPLTNCAIQTCPGGTPASGSDLEARVRFRDEQTTTPRGLLTTMDLDSNGQDDLAEHGWSWIAARVQIHEADSTQVTVENSNFGIGSSFRGTSNADCLARKRFDTSNQQCFIVVQAEYTYRPLVLSWIVGKTMTIRATSVKAIVQGV